MLYEFKRGAVKIKRYLARIPGIQWFHGFFTTNLPLGRFFRHRSQTNSSKDQIKGYGNQRELLEFYSFFINEGDLCFDVGANIGIRTEAFLKLGAKIVCVEPQESCFKILMNQYKNNSNVILINEGLAEKEGYLKLHICENATTISTMSDKWMNEGRFSDDYKWTKIQLIPVTTLDKLIKKYGLPKLCKIDVEGFEFPVLNGLHSPIPYISFEFTREFFDDAKKCIDYLLSIGPAKFNCSIGESYQLLLPSWTTPDDLYAKLESFDQEDLWGDIYVKF